MRIVEIEPFGRGGLLHYAFNLSSALVDRGHEVTLVTSHGYELEGSETPAGLRVDRRTARWSQRSGDDPTGRRRGAWVRRFEALYDALAVAVSTRRRRPDVVHLHTTNPIGLVYVLLLRLLGLPVVTTAHVVTPHEPIPFERWIFSTLYGRSRLVIAHSRVDWNRLGAELGVPEERRVVIPHGEYGFFSTSDEAPDRDEARRDLGLQPADEVVLFFGYLREYKGLDVLLDAWERVRERPAARLLIAGDPVRLASARRRELETRAEELGATCHFDYIPFESVTRYFAAADLLVMPYRRISQSGVLFLALALGVPVVATRVGALPEMLESEESAILVPPDDPDRLADALLRALEDPTLRRRLVEGGHRVAAAHSWSSIAEASETAFEHLTPG